MKKEFILIQLLGLTAMSTPLAAHTVYYVPAASPTYYVPAASPTYVYAEQAPPAALTEEIPASPGEGYVWIKGYWSLVNGNWQWVKGHWELRPAATAYYVPGYWYEHPHHHHWYYVSGYWQ